jgi:hypothetical protein
MLVPTMEGLGGGVSTRVAVEIGGVCLALEAATAEVRLELSRSLRLFSCAPDNPDMIATVSRRELGGRRRGGRRLFRSIVSGFRNSPGWELWAEGDERVFWLTSPALGRAPSQMARFDATFRRGEISLHERYFPPGQPIDPLPHPLDELLVMHWLAQGRGVELRASGIIDEDGRGYLFAGSSGAGKTTLSRLWLAHGSGVVISDDRVVVRRDGDRLWMYGTPWHGEAELSAPQRAAVAGIFLLEKSADVECLPLAGAQAAPPLLATALVPFYAAGAREHAARLVTEMTAMVPCARLRFRRDARFLEVVRRGADH